MNLPPATPDRPDYDQALKWILASAPQGFLDLIAPGFTWEHTLSPELPAERVIAAPLPRGEQSEITGTLVLLAGVNLPLDTIIEAIRRRPMLGEIFEESSVAQWLMEKGQEEGRRQMVRAALEGRFGTLSEDLLAALNAADEAALRDVVAHIGTDSLEQARSRLGLS